MRASGFSSTTSKPSKERPPWRRPSVPNFSHAAHQAQQWVHELADDPGRHEQRAYHLLKAALVTLRDWLSRGGRSVGAASRPLRGIYFEGWEPSLSLAMERAKRDFVIRARRSFGYEMNVDFDVAINAVFKLLDGHISQGEIVQVRNSMKKSLRELWPAH